MDTLPIDPFEVLPKVLTARFWEEMPIDCLPMEPP
jgi:hypothetical protein